MRYIYIDVYILVHSTSAFQSGNSRSPTRDILAKERPGFRTNGVITEVEQFPIANCHGKMWQDVTTYCKTYGMCVYVCQKMCELSRQMAACRVFVAPVCIYIYIYIYIYTCVCRSMYIYIYIYMYAYTCMMYTYTYIYIYIFITVVITRHNIV